MRVCLLVVLSLVIMSIVAIIPDNDLVLNTDRVLRFDDDKVFDFRYAHYQYMDAAGLRILSIDQACTYVSDVCDRSSCQTSDVHHVSGDLVLCIGLKVIKNFDDSHRLVSVTYNNITMYPSSSFVVIKSDTAFQHISYPIRLFRADNIGVFDLSVTQSPTVFKIKYSSASDILSKLATSPNLPLSVTKPYTYACGVTKPHRDVYVSRQPYYCSTLLNICTIDHHLNVCPNGVNLLTPKYRYITQSLSRSSVGNSTIIDNKIFYNYTHDELKGILEMFETMSNPMFKKLFSRQLNIRISDYKFIDRLSQSNYNLTNKVFHKLFNISLDQTLESSKYGNFISDAIIALFSPFFDLFKEALHEYWITFAPILKEFLKAILELIISLLQDVVSLLSGLLTNLERDIEKLVDLFNSLLTIIFSLVVKLIKHIEAKCMLFEYVCLAVLLNLYIRSTVLIVVSLVFISFFVGFERSYPSLIIS